MSNQDEIFDIYDDKLNWIGTAPRSEVHKQGYWHQTFQCWILSCEGPEPSLLLQLRSADKDLFPNLLDISSAGHLAAGETMRDGVRELEEELGLKVEFDELLACGTFAEEDLVSETLIDREFCHIFIYRCDQPLKAYQLQEEEVSGIFAVNMKELEQLVSGDAATVTVKGIIPGSGEVIRAIALSDLVPHPAAYYQLLFQALRRYELAGK